MPQSGTVWLAFDINCRRISCNGDRHEFVCSDQKGLWAFPNSFQFLLLHETLSEVPALEWGAGSPQAFTHFHLTWSSLFSEFIPGVWVIKLAFSQIKTGDVDELSVPVTCFISTNFFGNAQYIALVDVDLSHNFTKSYKYFVLFYESIISIIA